MARAQTPTTLLLLLLLAAASALTSASPSPHHASFFRPKKPKLTFSFYAQEYLFTGTPTTFFIVPPLPANATAASAAPSPAPAPATTTGLPAQLFHGAISIVDPAVTRTADPESPELGRLKGASVFDNSREPGAPDAEAIWTVVFNGASGYGDGSSISFRGYYQTLKPARELAVVGGTGYFRLVRGWVVVTTAFLDVNTGRAINNFTVSLL